MKYFLKGEFVYGFPTNICFLSELQNFMIYQDVIYSKAHRFLHGLLQAKISAPLQADMEGSEVQGLSELQSELKASWET